MNLSPPITVVVLLAFLLVGLLPKVPAVAKVALQVLIGLGIYFGMSEAMFALPYGDNLPISDLFGGSGGQPGFNKLSMGFLCTVLGLVFTGIGTLINFILFKKED